MRFMLMVISVRHPSAAHRVENLTKMMQYNDALQKAGVLLALDELFPASTGARISYADGAATVADGPFEKGGEAIGGYWIIQVRSREEAIEWARRAPMSDNEVVEVRQVHDTPDFPDDVPYAA